MIRILENYYGVLLRPNETFKKIFTESNFGTCLLTLLFISLISTFNYAGFLNIKDNYSNLFLLFFFTLGVYLFFWFFTSILLTFIANILGGNGKISETMIGIGISSFPLIFSSPIYSLPNIVGDLGFTIQLIGMIFIYGWTFILIIISLKESQKFSLDKAISSIILSIFFGVVLILMFLLLIVLCFTLFISL